MALIQYYEDDLLGSIRFVDKYANHHGLKAQPSHIRLDKAIPESERSQIRRAIADSINGVENERDYWFYMFLFRGFRGHDNSDNLACIRHDSTKVRCGIRFGSVRIVQTTG